MPVGGIGSSLDVYVQDQSSEIVDLYMCKPFLITTLAAGAALEANQFTLTSVAGIATNLSKGVCLDIMQNGHTMQGLVQSVVGNVVTINTPSDRAFTAGAIVSCGLFNMNAVGSPASRQIFMVAPPVGTKWDICRIIVGIIDDTPMDDTTFGGIPSLTNGVILRKKNGVYQNVFVVNNNKGWRDRSFDLAYVDKRPAGSYGFGVRRTFNGQEKNGVVIRLDGDMNDELQMIIQDDLSGLVEMSCVVQGHVVV